MRNYVARPYRPMPYPRLKLGQTSAFDDMISPSNGVENQVVGANTIKTVGILSGLALTGLSAATAYVAISYGMEKNRKTFQKILGWTVGVLGAVSGLARLASTGALIMTPAEKVAGAVR